MWLLDLFKTSFVFVLVSILEYTLANWLMRVEARVSKKVIEATKKLREARKELEEQLLPCSNNLVQSQSQDDVRAHSCGVCICPPLVLMHLRSSVSL